MLRCHYADATLPLKMPRQLPRRYIEFSPSFYFFYAFIRYTLAFTMPAFFFHCRHATDIEAAATVSHTLALLSLHAAIAAAPGFGFAAEAARLAIFTLSWLYAVSAVTSAGLRRITGDAASSRRFDYWLAAS